VTGHRFEGEICVYCNLAPSAADDHVFARKFFLETRRDSKVESERLPQVPCCHACNGAKAELESYAMVVLPFGGRHADGFENLSRLAARRLENKANARIRRTLQASVGQSWIVENGVVRGAMTIDIDWAKVEALFVYIAKGLVWHHFNHQRLGADSFVVAHASIGPVGRTLRHLRRLNSRDRIERDLGAGTFQYWGVQGVDNPQVTVWDFAIYGGQRTVRSGDEPHNVGVMTGPLRLSEKVQHTSTLLWQWRRGVRLHG